MSVCLLPFKVRQNKVTKNYNCFPALAVFVVYLAAPYISTYYAKDLHVTPCFSNNFLKVFMWLLHCLKCNFWLHAVPCIFTQNFKGTYPMQLLQYFQFTLWLHVAPCISRLYFKGPHAAPVVFEVYTVAPCSSTWLL